MMERFCYKIWSLFDQARVGVCLRANNGGGAGPSDVPRGEMDVYDAVKAEKADEENRDLDGLMNAAEAIGSDFREKFRELQAEFRGVHTKMPAFLVDVVKMPKSKIMLEGYLEKSEKSFRRQGVGFRSPVERFQRVNISL